MKRLMDQHLREWKVNRYRKPLIIRGARQVGKTYGVRQFARSFDHFVEIDFELRKEVCKIFERDLVPERILQELSLFSGQSIVPGKTLLFFDELQECPRALISMRYFYEEMPDLHLIAASSLLSLATQKVGMPVGRVASMAVFPLSFMEFLVAIGESPLAQAVIEQKQGLPMEEVVHIKLLDLLGRYLMIGGMPEAVVRWIATKDFTESFRVHHRLIEVYRHDFKKYAKTDQLKYLDLLLREIPRQTGKQFKYSCVRGKYRKRELDPCLDLLCFADVVHRVDHLGGSGTLYSLGNWAWFKILFLDVALSQTILGLDLSSWFLDPKATFANREEIVQGFIGQELLCYSGSNLMGDLYFWKGDPPRRVQVDFLFRQKGNMIPIEVKNDDQKGLQSLRYFLDEQAESSHGIRFSTHNYSTFKKIDSRPLYAAVSLAHEEQLKNIEALF